MIKIASCFRFGGNAAKLFLLGALILDPGRAQDATRNSILQNKADQQVVREHTAALAGQIQGLIDELGENGISGDDIKVLQTTKSVLSSLSAEEMARVITSLQKAGEAAGTKTAEQSVVDAYAGQKGIILEFRQILKEYEQREAADELPARFKELTDRQTQVMWTTAQVAAETAGKNQSELTTLQQTTAQIVQTDQNALVNDVAMAKQMLAKAAPNSTGDEGRAMQQAQTDLQDGKLQNALDQANADLTAGHLLQATTEQKIARDQLRQVARDLNPPTTTVDALSDFAATLNKLIDEQKDLLAQTNAADGIKPRVTGLDGKEGMLVDQANSLQEDMQSLSPTPAGLVKDAITPMQLARAALGPTGGGRFASAVTSEQDAIDKLEEAAKELTQQVADAQKAADAAAQDSTAKLQAVQQQIQQAMQQQQQTAQQTAQANGATPPDASTLAQAQQQQGQLQQQAAALQQTAAPLSLPATQALANAANAMSQAQQAMSNPATAQAAQADQQAAEQDLQQANQAVAQQIAQNQQQATDPSQLTSAANDLQQAQTAVSNAIADSNPPSSGTPPSTAPTMAQAQAALTQAAQATQAAASVPGLPDAVAGAVQAAQKSIAQGQQTAAQGDAPATATAAAAAQASLAQAQAAVAVAQAGMTPGPATPGGPPDATPTPPGPDMASTDGAQIISGGSTDKGTLHAAGGDGKFITVMNRERASISETQGENRPQEYAPMIDQYLKNLADQSTSSP